MTHLKTTVRPYRYVLLLVVAVLVAACSPSPEEERGASGEGGTEPPVTSRTTSPAVGSDGFAAIPDIVAELQPSIVSINVLIEDRGQTGAGSGSGVIWDADGLIVTNHHVVGPASDIEVVLANGERFPGELVASDPRTDLAVVRIEASGLPPASFADRLPEVGELAVALGNPLGFQNSATAGIISGVDRALPATPDGPALVGLIQTDAPISSGNSGGALVDGRGEVVGINVAAIGTGEGGAQARITAENVGFAIPSTTVISVVRQLLEDGSVSHPFLGVRGATLTAQIAERFGIERDFGFVVAEVVPGGPADEAGMEPGDLIVSLAGDDVRSFGDLASIIRDQEVGDTVEVTIVRDGQEEHLEVTLAELPDGDRVP